MPLLSVLMPSRNRGRLLEVSLETILNQSFGDFELVISDNMSTDNTAAVAKAAMARSPKVRYIQPDRDLSMVDHYEFVRTQAKGDYLIFLSDDDGIIDNGLDYIARVLTAAPTRPEILVWQRAGYGWPDLVGQPNCEFLAYRLRSGKTYEVKSSLVLDILCDFDQTPNYHFIGPKITNCAIARTAFDKAVKQTGRFFMPPYPDYTTLSQLLSTHASYTLIDQPMYICGSSVAANSAMYAGRKKKVLEYNSLFGPGEITLDDVPYPMEYLSVSYMCATYLKFKKIYPDTFTSPINWINYLRALYAELAYYEHFEDVSAELEQLRGYMQKVTGSDQLFQSLRSTSGQSSRKASLMYQLRKFAATNDLTRSLAGTAMRLLGMKNADAQQYSHVKSISEAATLITRDLKAAGRFGPPPPHEPLDRPDMLSLLA